MSVRKANTGRMSAESLSPFSRAPGHARPTQRRQSRKSNHNRTALARLSESEVRALLRKLEADVQEEPSAQVLEDTLDADFDEDAGLWGHIDPLSAHVRRKSSIQPMLADEDDAAW
ncbi:hypothetical protein [Methylobacterium soli]|uniref:Uncharacterized protein n=1 Tax=Methylobacterium soli TaxID=553447 RepID=A0A6L3T1P9_9HYPH|nr:hypothetical protein [Methylobacterium soli]KAB1080560.1 hypothetical protein F6X53_05015 [Methylobacterium soli]GJE44924.1 hypothetical protein AEGHOMDF_4117 [Methylobacterium soli]